MLSTTPANLSLCRSSEPRQVKHAMPHAGAPNQAGSKEFNLSAVAPTNGGTDKTITLRARADASVADLKGQLATKCGLAVDDRGFLRVDTAPQDGLPFGCTERRNALVCFDY